LIASAVLWALAIAALGWAYLRSWRAARVEAGAGAANGWRLLAFATAIVLLVAALVGPLPEMSQRLLAAHVVQHLLILDFVPILLALSTTPAVLAPIDRHLRRLAASPLGSPPVLLVVYAGSLAFWHIPPLYDAALAHPALHVVQNLQILAAGTLFWWRELAPSEYRATRGIGVLFQMAGAKFLTGILASMIAFMPVLYDHYAALPPGSMTAAEDQQLGGLIMLAVEAVLFTVMVSALFVLALAESDPDEPDPPPPTTPAQPRSESV